MSLNTAQLQAVRHVDGPLLVLAGAGTGKTRVITERTAHLIERGVAAANILCVTFTNKAAREMRDRIHRRVGRAKSKGLAVHTFHGFGALLLRRWIDRLGYRRPFTIMGMSDQLGLVRTALRDIGEGGRGGSPVKPDAVLDAISSAKGASRRPDRDTPAGELAEAVFDRYQRLLRACNAVDFDDLLVLPNRLLDTDRDVRAGVRAQYRYLQVDEFQDTNALQLDLIKAIAAEHRNVCVVGDDDQAIYGWRGAQVRNILEFDRVFGTARTRVVRLEQNYRSTETILAAANAVIASTPGRHEKRLFSHLGQGAPVRLVIAEDEPSEVRAVVDHIAEHQGRGGTLNECAVLFRTNTMTRPFEELLRERQMPYVLIGGQRYFDRKEVKDALAYLRLVVNPADDVSFIRVVNYPSRGVGATSLDRFTAHAANAKLPLGVALERAGASLDAVAGLSDLARAGLGSFRRILHDARGAFAAAAPTAMGGLVQALLDASRIQTAIEQDVENPADALRRWTNVSAIADSLAGFVARAVAETPAAGEKPLELLGEYLERVALVDDQDSADNSARLRREALVLITIHSCKGLEFPHVTIVGFEEGLIPHRRSEAESLTGDDEERRLAYVAITRAKQTLTLTMAQSRTRFGKTVETQPSRFLKDIPSELFDTEQAASVRKEQRARAFSSIRDALGGAGDRGDP